jgi:hypothetical protein
MIPFFGLLRFTVHEEDNHMAQNGNRFSSLLVWQWAVYKDSGSRRIVELTHQDLLHNRRLQAEEPSLGFGSAITKERKQNEHDQTANQALQDTSAVLLPWEALYEFGRMICLGLAVTFGGHAQRRKSKGPPT